MDFSVSYIKFQPLRSEGGFIVEVTFIDSSRNGLIDISFYIEEYADTHEIISI